MIKLRNNLALLALFALYYLLPLNFRPLWQPDETRYAEISREMLASGDWIVPHLLGLRYFEKPIAGYWINSIGQWLWGHNNFAVRFGSLLAISLTALLVAWMAWQLWRDRRLVILSAVIFLTAQLVYAVGTYAALDSQLTLWMALAMCSFWQAAQAQSSKGKLAGYALLGVACGMGVMTKGFLALAVPVVGVLPWLIASRRWREVLIWGWLAVVVCALLILPWGVAIAQREPDFWRYFFWVEHIQRFAEEDAQHKAPFWYYIPFLLAGSLPWLALLPGALRCGWHTADKTRGTLYLLGWVVMPFLFFSIAKGKLPTYILPCFVPLAILLARYARDAAQQGAKVLQINGLINVIFGVIGLIAMLVISPWGIMQPPLWSSAEWYKWLAAAAAFAVWAVMGGVAMRHNGRRWILSACCPLGIGLLIGCVMPNQVINNKQPQLMINAERAALTSSRYVLCNNVGIAAGLAWELKRDDIIIYDNQGELKYGLSWPDARQQFVSHYDFAVWLATHRQAGPVSLVLLMDKRKNMADLSLPPPDKIYQRGRVAYFQYLPQ